MKLFYLVTIPVSLLFLLHSKKIHPGYQLSWWKRIALALHVIRNKHSIQTGTSFKSTLVMALKLFELSPETAGVVVECGTWKGGAASRACLFACRIVGRQVNSSAIRLRDFLLTVQQ